MNTSTTSARRRVILHVLPTLSRAGTETSCFTLARALGRMGHVNHAVALVSGQQNIRDSIASVASLHPILPAERFRKMVAFYRLCKRIRPDAVVMHYFSVDHVSLGLMARLAGVGPMSTTQGNPAPATDKRLSRKIRVILGASRILGIYLICSSEWIKITMCDVGPLPHTHVIPYGSEIQDISRRASLARDARESEGPLVIGMVARLDRIKDHETLIRAFSLMPAFIAGRPLVLRLIGDGSLRSQLEKLVVSLQMSGRVTFVGACSDVASELGQIDVFAFSTTRDEGFGIVLVEALAAGVPVVATDVPPCREVLGDLGVLVPAGDAEKWAEALRAVLMHPPGAADQELLTGRFGPDVFAEAHLDFLFGGES